MKPNLSDTLFFLVEYLNFQEAVGDPDAKWEAFQLQHLNNLSLLAIELKSRQVGWSWLAAAEAVANSHIEKNTPNIFISINQEEASEKIRYAKIIHEALDKDVRRKLIVDNRLELEFDNGCRIISHPCRPVRGKARAHLYLDEFAHYPNDQEIYQSALPVISKGGTLRIGSSPLGARGRFWEIYTESFQRYPGYVRSAAPWWTIFSFCKNVKEAIKLAPFMPTDERVRIFGKSRILQIYENMPIDDFQQEYECAWLDETVSWIDWELIKRNQTAAQEGKLIYYLAKGVDQAFEVVDRLVNDLVSARVEQVFTGGMDVGRKKDLSEIVLTGVSSTGQLPFRLGISLDRVEFDDQKAVVCRIMDALPVRLFLIDETGIGAQLAEDLERLYSPKVDGLTFSSESKRLLAVETKLKAQRGEVPLPIERDLTYQIHSIKKIVTESSNVAFDNSRTKDGHHADKFWAWALAVFAARQDLFYESSVDMSALAGYRG